MELLPELTLQTILFRLVILTIIVAVQGFVVAATVVALGDPGPRFDGRLTVVPSSHFNVVGGVSLILFGIGWGQPMAIDPFQFKRGPIGIVLVILAASLAVVLTALIFRLLVIPAITTLPYTAGLATAAFLRLAAKTCIWFALFNLLPIPPLTGGYLLSAFNVNVPRQVVWVLEAGLVVLIALGFVRWLLEPGFTFLATPILGDLAR